MFLDFWLPEYVVENKNIWTFILKMEDIPMLNAAPTCQSIVIGLLNFTMSNYCDCTVMLIAWNSLLLWSQAAMSDDC